MWILLGLIVAFFTILGYMLSLSGMPILTIPKRLTSILRFAEKKWIHILYIVLLILGILIVINYNKFDLNPSITKEIQSVVSVESLKSTGSNY